MLVNKPPKFNAREASIADKDKGRAKRPNEIWSSKFGELPPNRLIAGTRRLTSEEEKKPETLIPPLQPRLHPASTVWIQTTYIEWVTTSISVPHPLRRQSGRRSGRGIEEIGAGQCSPPARLLSAV
jgi:hypothetical protein